MGIFKKIVNKFVLASLAIIAVSANAATQTENCFNFVKAQDYARAVQAGKDAIKSSPKSGDAFFCLGVTYSQQGEIDLALSKLLQAERLYTNKNDLEAVYSRLGQVVNRKGDLQQAMSYYSRALGLARDLGDKSGEAASLNNIASIFQDRGELDKALDYYQQALDVEPLDSKKATKYNNIAMVYSARAEYPKAIEYIDKAIALDQRSGDFHSAAIVILNKGAVQTDQGVFDDAEVTLKQGLIGIRKVGDQYWESIALMYFGQLAQARGRTDEAKQSYRDALKIAHSAGAKSAEETIARKLAVLQKDSSTISYGVVEIGSKGVKAAVVTSFTDEQGRVRYQTGFKKSINTNVLQGVVDTGEFSVDAIENTAKAVQDLIAEIRANSKNIGDNIFIVGSSALSIAMNRNELADKVAGLIGSKPYFVNSAEELTYGMIGSIPDSLLHKTALLDIGSGNGRVGYLISARGDKPAGQAVIDLSAGSLSLTELANKAKAPGESFVNALNRVVEKDVAPRFATQIKQYPVLSKHHYLMVVGGAAWSMSTLMHPENQGAYVPLTFQDFNDYFNRITQNPETLLNPDLSSISDVKIREAAAKQIEDVKKVFTVENLQAGARILKLAADTVPIGKAEIYFSRDGNWAYGFAEGIMINRRLASK